jgi:nucleotide-binding universal stress UspA family protein
MRTFRRIVHPSDFSPASRPAFRKAIQLAKSHRAQLFVVHVLSMLPVIPDAYVAPTVWDDLERGQRTTAQRQLARLVAAPSPLKAAEQAARAIGLTLKIFEVRAVEDFPRAFEAAKQGRAQALLQLGSPLFGSNPVPVAELARMHRLPSMCEQQRLTAAGCLMSYGPNFSEMYRRAAYYVDKILKGAKPADLPVEQPTKFELVINLKTARALGLTIPQSLLVRADQIIE